MTTGLTIERKVHFAQVGKGARQELRVGPAPTPPAEAGRLPRVARLMALAIRFEGLVQSRAVKDYAELARLGRVTRARISQIMNLLHLAPDIQEEILFLPRTERGRDPVILRQLQPIASIFEWRKQRRLWRAVVHARGKRDAG